MMPCPRNWIKADHYHWQLVLFRYSWDFRDITDLTSWYIDHSVPNDWLHLAQFAVKVLRGSWTHISCQKLEQNWLLDFTILSIKTDDQVRFQTTSWYFFIMLFCVVAGWILEVLFNKRFNVDLTSTLISHQLLIKPSNLEPYSKQFGCLTIIWNSVTPVVKTDITTRLIPVWRKYAMYSDSILQAKLFNQAAIS